MHEIEKEIISTQAQQELLEYAQRLNHDEDRQILLDEVVNRNDKLQRLWEEIKKNQASIVQGGDTFRKEHTKDNSVHETDSYSNRQINIRL